MKIYNKVHDLNPDVIDLKRLERETYKFLYIGLVVAVLFHAGILFLYPIGKTKIVDVKNIQVELVNITPRITKQIIIPPRITRPISTPKSTTSDIYHFRRKSGIGVPSAPRGLRAPSGIDYGGIKMSDIAHGISSGKPTGSLSDSIIIGEILNASPKDNIPLKDEVFIDTGEFKSMVVFPPDNKMAVQGYTHLAMAFGTNLSPNDDINNSIRNLAEAVNSYTNIEALGEEVWLCKSPAKILTKYTPDMASQAVGIDGSFKASEGFPKTHDYEPTKELSKYPLIYISSDKPFTISDEEILNIKNYLSSGGFIILDNPIKENDKGAVSKSLKNVVINAFSGLSEVPFIEYIPLKNGKLEPVTKYRVSPIIPETSFKPIPKNHELYHCFFDFENGSFGMAEDSGIGKVIEGIYLGGRMIGLYTMGYGRSWGDRRNEEQLKMGVNMVVHALKQGKGKFDWGQITPKTPTKQSVVFTGSGKMKNLSKGNVKVW